MGYSCSWCTCAQFTLLSLKGTALLVLCTVILLCTKLLFLCMTPLPGTPTPLSQVHDPSPPLHTPGDVHVLARLFFFRYSNGVYHGRWTRYVYDTFFINFDINCIAILCSCSHFLVFLLVRLSSLLAVIPSIELNPHYFVVFESLLKCSHHHNILPAFMFCIDTINIKLV